MPQSDDSQKRLSEILKGDNEKAASEEWQTTMPNEDSFEEEFNRYAMSEWHEEGIAQKRQDRRLQLKFGSRVAHLLTIWVWFLIAVVLLGGFKCYKWFEFTISDTVLIALISGATVNTFALALIVVKHLFPEQAGKK